MRRKDEEQRQLIHLINQHQENVSGQQQIIKESRKGKRVNSNKHDVQNCKTYI